MSQRICSIDGCDKLVHARGWCGGHYARWRRYGNPLQLIRRPRNMPPVEFKRWFEDQFRIEPGPFDTPCWIWTGTTDTPGYGQVRLQGRLQLVHRLAWKYRNGPISDGLSVCHIDDHNRLCCNPEHLYLGTHAENMADLVKQGRHVSQRRAASA